MKSSRKTIQNFPRKSIFLKKKFHDIRMLIRHFHSARKNSIGSQLQPAVATLQERASSSIDDFALDRTLSRAISGAAPASASGRRAWRFPRPRPPSRRDATRERKDDRRRDLGGRNWNETMTGHIPSSRFAPSDSRHRPPVGKRGP